MSVSTITSLSAADYHLHQEKPHSVLTRRHSHAEDHLNVVDRITSHSSQIFEPRRTSFQTDTQERHLNSLCENHHSEDDLTTIDHEFHKPHTLHTTHDTHDIQDPHTLHTTHEAHGTQNTGGITSAMLDDHVTAIGLLTPALAFVPELRQADCIYEHYKELRGAERDLILAAAHIDDARTGRGRYGRAKYYFKEKPARVSFKIITNKWFQRLIYAAVLLHSLLTFIEPPSVDPLSSATLAALFLNLLCLSIYLLDIILNIIFLSWRVFWTYEERSWNRVQFAFLCCFVIDWILLVAQISSNNRDLVQPFRCLRLAMIVCKAKNVGHITYVVKSITVKLSGIVFIVLVFILLYSCIGLHLVMEPFEMIEDVNISSFRPADFETVSELVVSENETIVFIETCQSSAVNDTNIYEGTFNHIGTAVYQLFILLTTENYPIFMFPAYFYSQWYFIYFGTFVFFGVFFITSILLAIIADLYWQYNKKHVKKERAKQRAELVKAWKILDVMGQEKLPIDDERFLALFRLLKPKNTDSENRVLIAELDPEHTGWVDWIYWVTQLLSILDLEKTSHHIPGKVYTDLTCMAVVSRIARKITAWVVFDRTVLLLIITHSVLFALKWQGMDFTAQIIIQGLRTAIVTLFIVEMTIRVVGRGKGFFTNVINTLDFALVAIAFLSNITWYGVLNPQLMSMVEPFLWSGGFVVLSSLAIFMRLFFNSQQSRQVMTVFFRLVPVMMDLIILFGIVLYFYGVLGMEIFHSFTITANTPDANHLQYDCGLGFKDFKCSLFILFQILTTSNWHEIMNTVIVSLNSYAPVIYFIPCFIVINFIIMNLLVAIGIEAFNKFSQEHKDEEKDAESQSPNSSMENRTMKENFEHYGRKFLSGLKSFAGIAFTSARVSEEEQQDNSVIHIEIQSQPSSDHVTQSRPPSDQSSGYLSSPLSSRSSGHFSSSSGPGVNDTHGSLVMVNQSSDQQDVEDDVFEQSASNQTKPSPPTTSTPMSRQEKMKQRMKEKQKQLRMKRPAQAVATAISLQSKISPGADTAEETSTIVRTDTITSMGHGDLRRQSTDSVMENGSLWRRSSIKKWGAAAQAVAFVSKFGANEDDRSENADQFDGELKKPGRGRLDTGPKFRRGYNPGNWRSEVQNITIINREEIHELRRQLAARPSINHKPWKNSKQASMDSVDSVDSGYHGNGRRRPSVERQKRNPFVRGFTQSSIDSTLTLNQYEDGTPDGTKHVNFSPTAHFISRRLSCDSHITSEDVCSPVFSNQSSNDQQPPTEPTSRKRSMSRNSIEMDSSVNNERPASSKPKDLPLYLTGELREKGVLKADCSQVSTPQSSRVQGRVSVWRRLSKLFDGETKIEEEMDGEGASETATSFDQSGEKRNSRDFFKTPLISVEEAKEAASPKLFPTERPQSKRLRVPLLQGKHLHSKASSNKANKEMPDWVKRLTEQYNVTVLTDNSP